MRTAIYPGTFDPVTKGHVDIIQRAASLFDRIVVAVAENENKRPLFSREERKRLLEETVLDLKNVEVRVFEGLLANYAGKMKAVAVIRGLRAVSDFEYEFQMALMNRKLNPDMETVFLMPSEEYTYINSSIVKEVARLGGEVRCFLPAAAATALMEKLNRGESGVYPG
ncbi:MAG TPA: pantetheine-phosphate adenylyltransferase [bacterium]|nr:pantetheine-phosphate adenylyltransferase [bacterium]